MSEIVFDAVVRSRVAAECEIHTIVNTETAAS